MRRRLVPSRPDGRNPDADERLFDRLVVAYWRERAALNEREMVYEHFRQLDGDRRQAEAEGKEEAGEAEG